MGYYETYESNHQVILFIGYLFIFDSIQIVFNKNKNIILYDNR
jgi:hypothetical protein